MKTMNAGRMAVIVAAALLAGFARPAVADLIFIDDFEDPIIRNSSPPPGMPGGGTIGGNNFWAAPVYWAGTSYVENGFLVFQIGPTNASSPTILRGNATHPEFNFMNTAAGEGLLFSVRGYSADWENELGRLYHGIMPQNADHYTASNAVYVIIQPTGLVSLLGKEQQPSASAATWASFTPFADERPTGLDLYLDSQLFILEVYYDDGSSRAAGGFHGFVTEWPNPRHFFWCEPAKAGEVAYVRVGEITVTQIPEPGSLALFGSFGFAWILRRMRRPA